MALNCRLRLYRLAIRSTVDTDICRSDRDVRHLGVRRCRSFIFSFIPYRSWVAGDILTTCACGDLGLLVKPGQNGEKCEEVSA